MTMQRRLMTGQIQNWSRMDNEQCLSFLDAKWRDLLQKAYSDESRHYHTLDHVHAMLRELQAIKPRFNPHKYALLELATWFHDAVYRTTETSVSNEIDSALLVDRFFQDHVAFDSSDAKRVQHLIMATRTHTIAPVDIDWTIVHDDGKRKQFINGLLDSGIEYDQELTKLFLDLDLSILGSSPDEYDAYSRKIRQEYIQYPWDTYRSRRIEILQRFLARPQLFFTDTFYAKYEATARQNIKREITLLQAATEDHFSRIHRDCSL